MRRRQRRTAPETGTTGVGTDAIIWAYRLFLGREPEDLEAAAAAGAQLTSWAEVHDRFTASAEYAGRAGVRRTSLTGHEPAMEIDAVTDRDQIADLHAHIRRSWTALGTNQPHHSVLTADAFLPALVDDNLDEFYASGAADVARMEATLRRNGLAQPAGTCFELGCGVGRITAWLAPRFRARGRR